MGDIAEAMLEGEMCEQCGEWLGDGPGYPRLCPGCASEERRLNPRQPEKPQARTPATMACPDCGKLLRGPAAVMQHQNAKHGAKHSPLTIDVTRTP